MQTDSGRNVMYLLSLCFLVMWVGTEMFEAYERREKWKVISDYMFTGQKEVTYEDKVRINDRVCTLERLQGIDCKMSTELDWHGRRKQSPHGEKKK